MLSNIPEEIQKIKIGNTPFLTVLWYIGIGFIIGGLITKQIDTNEMVINNRESAKEYTEQEVGGLRADWERENKEVHRRLNKLENKHFK